MTSQGHAIRPWLEGFKGRRTEMLRRHTLGRIREITHCATKVAMVVLPGPPSGSTRVKVRQSRRGKITVTSPLHRGRKRVWMHGGRAITDE